ncbi:Fe-S cluster assembly protein SufD [Thiomicrorhabdus sp.]|uniref:Fe-S cluster assembly protein SufD n=1 Tax=Thiomicrorhabdus sp. TaxID=2039724 RepID=UPI0029C7954F|nr:Fe-S cluster assembly protein SufD [Thiomicrorhabdus sp.]
MSRKMSPVAKKAVDFYLAQSQAMNSQGALGALRQQACARLAAEGFPTLKDEDWQYTRLSGFLQNLFANDQVPQLSAEQIAPYLPDFDVFKLVFVNGRFQAALSDDVSQLPKGVSFEPSATWLTNDEKAANLFVDETEMAKEPFANLNSALMQDGFVVQVAKNAFMEMPLLVLFVHTGGQADHSRNLVRIGENAEISWIERHVSMDAASFCNAVTTIDVAQNARVNQIVMQQMNDDDYYFANQYISQAESSVFNTFFVSTGSQIARHQNHLYMNGEHIESNQNSACLAAAKQTVDSRTHTEHNEVAGLSRQLHKFVLFDEAVGVFNGMIRVDQKAQKTDGQMDNKNLLLSDKAKMDTKPQLEIYADDVQCSHGSATGQIDKNQIFYLQARGIHREHAIRMITEAFLLEPLEELSKAPVRSWLMAELSQQLQKMNG